MPVQVISQELGPHEGWCRQQFMVGEQLYELFTIDRPSEKTSAIRRMVKNSIGDHIIGLHSMITPDDAYTIICILNGAKDTAYKQGKNDLRADFKRLLNIS